MWCICLSSMQAQGVGIFFDISNPNYLTALINSWQNTAKKHKMVMISPYETLATQMTFGQLMNGHDVYFKQNDIELPIGKVDQPWYVVRTDTASNVWIAYTTPNNKKAVLKLPWVWTYLSLIVPAQRNMTSFKTCCDESGAIARWITREEEQNRQLLMHNENKIMN